MTTINTEHLTLRPARRGDIDAVVTLYSDREISDNLPGAPWPRTELPRRIDKLLRGYEDHWKDHGFGPWAMLETDRNRFVGVCGLRHLPEEMRHPNKQQLREIELLVALSRDFWGRGYGAEASREALRYGFGVKGFEEIMLMSTGRDPRTERLMHKLNMGYQGDRPVMFTTLAVYAIRRNRWLLGDYKPPAALA